MLCECKEMILKTFIKPHPSSDKNLARRKKKDTKYDNSFEIMSIKETNAFMGGIDFLLEKRDSTNITQM